MNMMTDNDNFIDYKEGLERFCGSDMLYKEFLQKFTIDQGMENLEAAMRKHDYDDAFFISHALKGVTGNLSLKLLYADICVLVELLRGGKDVKGADDKFDSVIKDYNRTIAAIKDMIV